MVDSLHSVCFWMPDVAFGYDLGLAAKASSRFSHGYALVLLVDSAMWRVRGKGNCGAAGLACSRRFFWSKGVRGSLPDVSNLEV